MNSVRFFKSAKKIRLSDRYSFFDFVYFRITAIKDEENRKWKKTGLLQERAVFG